MFILFQTTGSIEFTKTISLRSMSEKRERECFLIYLYIFFFCKYQNIYTDIDLSTSYFFKNRIILLPRCNIVNTSVIIPYILLPVYIYVYIILHMKLRFNIHRSIFRIYQICIVCFIHSCSFLFINLYSLTSNNHCFPSIGATISWQYLSGI